MRYQVYEALAQLIVQAGRRSRLVIALDDLQWADGPLLELIEFLAGYVIGSPVLFVATVRLGSTPVIRLAIGNAATTEADVRRAWEVLRECAHAR